MTRFILIATSLLLALKICTCQAPGQFKPKATLINFSSGTIVEDAMHGKRVVVYMTRDAM